MTKIEGEIAGTGGLRDRSLPTESSGAYTTDRLARMVTDTRFADLPESVVAATRRLILDEIVVTAAAYETPMARVLYRLRGDRGGVPEATLIVDGRKVPAASAAYIHAQLANLLDADETMHNRMHAASASVHAGLAVAEMTGVSGKELIAAVATGYEIAARVGTSMKQWVPDGKGGNTYASLVGYSWMTLGAAATTSRLLGSDSLTVARALGQAFVTTPIYFDIQRNADRLKSDRPDSWHKFAMSGAMSASGVEAALLAADGWIAEEDILDESSGFWKSFGSPGCDFGTLYSDIGSRWRIADTSIKPYPFCRFGHGALDTMARLVSEHKISAEDIARINVRIPPDTLSRELVTNVHAQESLDIMGSLPTGLALVALGVTPGPKWFNYDLSDPILRGLADRVDYEVEDGWGAVLAEQLERDGFFSRLPNELTIRTSSGAEYRGYTAYAKGDPWSPETAYGDADVAKKAHQYLEGILPPAQVEQLIDAVLTVESATDVSAIARAVTA